MDSVLFRPYATKKSGVIHPKKGFDFKDKKIAFFSCTVNSDTKGKGVLSKKMFFDSIKPRLGGIAGRGLITFTEMEKKEVNGSDAVIMIDCPYPNLTRKQLIAKLVSQHD